MRLDFRIFPEVATVVGGSMGAGVVLATVLETTGVVDGQDGFLSVLAITMFIGFVVYLAFVVRRANRAGPVPVERPLIKCPGCDLHLPADDGWAQKRHMEESHPDIIEQRLTNAGFRRRDNRWVDTLGSPD